jgi:hypothetical protein
MLLGMAEPFLCWEWSAAAREGMLRGMSLLTLSSAGPMWTGFLSAVVSFRVPAVGGHVIWPEN